MQRKEEKMIELLKLLEFIWCAVLAVITIIWDIIWLWYFFKCFGIENCNNRKCKYKNYCFRYKGKLTEEECKKLLEILEQYKE